MGATELQDETVDIEVEVSSLASEELPVEWSLSSGLGAELRLLGAPESLADGCDLAAAKPTATKEVRSLIEDAELFLLGGDGHKELVDSKRVSLPMLVLGAAAPDVADSSVSATMAMTGASEAGLELKIAGLGIGGGVKMSIKQDVTVKCKAGEGKLGYLLLPFIRETWNWTPPGAGEAFPITKFAPILDVTKIGTRANNADITTVLAAASGPPVPVGGGDAAHSSSAETERELSWKLELGLEFGESNKFGLSAGLTGSVAISTEYELPAGSFDRYWLSRPVGVCIVPSRG